MCVCIFICHINIHTHTYIYIYIYISFHQKASVNYKILNANTSCNHWVTHIKIWVCQCSCFDITDYTNLCSVIRKITEGKDDLHELCAMTEPGRKHEWTPEHSFSYLSIDHSRPLFPLGLSQTTHPLLQPAAWLLGGSAWDPYFHP